MSTFKFHNSVGEIVPWNANYVFPSQATKIHKHLIKLPPKNGGEFTQQQTMRIELPADNYLNTLNSTLQFDLTTTAANATADLTLATTAAPKGGNLLTFNSTTAPALGSVVVFKDAQGVNQARIVTASSATTATLDAPVGAGTSISAGFTAAKVYKPMKLAGSAHELFSRIRITYGTLVLEDLQEYDTLSRMMLTGGAARGYYNSSGSILDSTSSGGWSDGKGLTPGAYYSGEVQAILAAHSKRTYCLNMLSGILSLRKLLPIKWMGGTVAIELTLSSDAKAYISETLSPAMKLDNINYEAELIEYDSTFDAGIYQGLSTMGIPLKFASWHYHSFAVTGGNQQYQIHERARSCKMVMAVVKDGNAGNYKTDSQWFYHDLAKYPDANGVQTGTDGSIIQTYQFRIGGEYQPSQPVRCIQGGAEAYQELQKCYDTLGDFRADANISQHEWSAQGDLTDQTKCGVPGGIGNKFVMSASLECTDLDPEQISGINAEEQNDIALIMQAAGGPVAAGPKTLMAFVAYDSLLIVQTDSRVALIL